MKKNRFYSAGIAALLAALLAAGFSGCNMNSGTETPAGGQGSVEEDSPEEALVKEMRKYTAGFIFDFDEDDIGKDITSWVIELKGGQREDTSVQVSVADVDGSGLFRLDENGVLKLAALPPKPGEQEAGGDTDQETRETYKMFPGVGEVTLEFKKGDSVAALTVLCAIAEPGTEGARSGVSREDTALPWGYHGESIESGRSRYIYILGERGKSPEYIPLYGSPILVQPNYPLPILSIDKVNAVGLISQTNETASPYVKEEWLHNTQPEDLAKLLNERFMRDLYVYRSFPWFLIENYGSHLLGRVYWGADGELYHSEEDRIPIWEIVRYIPANIGGGPQVAEAMKQEYESGQDW